MSKLRVLLTSMICLISCACAANAKELELSQIQDFKIRLSEDGKRLHISGIDMESAWPIKKIRTKRNGSDLIVSIKLAVIMTKGSKSDFDESIELTPQIKRVLLGKSRSVIWQRD